MERFNEMMGIFLEMKRVKKGDNGFEEKNTIQRLWGQKFDTFEI